MTSYGSPPRRFPPVAAGPIGWLGALFLTGGIIASLAAILCAVLLIFRRDPRLVMPMVATYLISVLLVSVVGGLWYPRFKRAEQLQEQPGWRVSRLLGWVASAWLTPAGTGGAAVYVAFNVSGLRGTLYAAAIVALGAGVSRLIFIEFQNELRPGQPLRFYGPVRRARLTTIAMTAFVFAFSLLVGWILPDLTP